jgi:hypothetical protein
VANSSELGSDLCSSVLEAGGEVSVALFDEAGEVLGSAGV